VENYRIGASGWLLGADSAQLQALSCNNTIGNLIAVQPSATLRDEEIGHSSHAIGGH
jgi:hypothetical protein